MTTYAAGKAEPDATWRTWPSGTATMRTSAQFYSYLRTEEPLRRHEGKKPEDSFGDRQAA